MNRNLAICILAFILLGTWAFLRPRQAHEVWMRINQTVLVLIGVKPPQEYSAPRAYFFPTDSLIKSFTPEGVVLTDSSVWKVRDKHIITRWSIGHNITVELARDSQYPYFLVNKEGQGRVNARYLGKE